MDGQKAYLIERSLKTELLALLEDEDIKEAIRQILLDIIRQAYVQEPLEY